MKVDICISFYRRQAYWPLISHGLQMAKEYINKVIIVNAESWEAWVPESSNIPIICCEALPNKPGEFNYSAMVNRGIEAATSEYVVHCDDDVILQEFTIPNLLKHIEPTTFAAGTCHNVPPTATFSDLDRDADMYQHFVRSTNVPQGLASGPLWAVNRSKFLELGGFDERLIEYADQDGEFILRWMITYGIDTTPLTKALAYQIEPLNPKVWPKPKDPYYYSLLKTRMTAWVAKYGQRFYWKSSRKGVVICNEG